MRVTDLTKQNAIVRNMANNAEHLQKLQDSMATGRRINKLADDPVGATQVQDLRTKVAYMGTVQSNLQQNFLWLDRTEAELMHVSELLQDAKSLALSQANANADRNTRLVAAEEMRSIGDNLIHSGNAAIGKVFMFGGSKTLTPPLARGDLVQPAQVNVDQLSADVKFVLDPEQFAAEFEGYSSNPYVLRVTREGPLGKARYQVSDDGGKSWGKEMTLLPVVEMVREEGKVSDKVLLRFTARENDPIGDPLVFPEGLQYRFEPNPPVNYRGNEDKRMVAVSESKLLPLNVTGDRVFFQSEGAPDAVNVFETMLALERALVENDSKVIERRLDELDKAQQQVLANAASVGAVRKEMESQLDKLADRELTTVKRMSEIEDLNFAEATVDMNMASARHQATLSTSAKLIQPSLLSFLR
ncbi:MAG: hypothetical protein HY342_05685 [Candidatus Lambdaproteobacteria bacterium]|nr:hypothetical protein [Candidatus Lambdaproteobacteria bacterium]